MLIVGAKGHAKEILDVLVSNGQDTGEVYFFDDVSSDLPEKLFNKFTIIRDCDAVSKLFSVDPRFVLGIGGVQVRKLLFDKMVNMGGIPLSVIANSASIGSFDVELGTGVNVMHNVIISSSVCVGVGCLINASSALHHDVILGGFCEISPGAIITGNVSVGSNTYIGSGAIILPKMRIGNNVVIGAGAVVTKNIDDNAIVIGVPAKAK